MDIVIRERRGFRTRRPFDYFVERIQGGAVVVTTQLNFGQTALYAATKPCQSDALVRNSFCKKYFTRKSFNGSSHNKSGKEFRSRSRG
jgi:hypothetical protein